MMHPQRLTSLDTFRGIIIAGMILVTDPGTYSAVYPQLRHAEWNGATATDMIFPSFLFMVGFSIALSVTARLRQGAPGNRIALHILYRTVILLLLGLLVNGFPEYDLHMLRLPGILQRIALCYFFCGLFYLYLNNNFNTTGKTDLSSNLFRLGAVALVLLIAYWAALVLVPVPGIGTGHLDSYGDLPAYIDRKVIGINHMWVWGLTPGKGVTYDPEGILSTLPAVASTLIGVLTGEWWLHTTLPQGKRALRLSVFGAVLTAAGMILSHYLPINKRIWTTTFALLSSGVALLLFALLYTIVDAKGYRKWTGPFLILGSNAILAFVISSVITTLADRIYLHDSGERLSLHQYGNKLCLLTGLSPVNASLLYAVVIVVLNMLIIIPLYRKKIFIKI